MNNFKLVKIDSDYCDYLRQYDDKVPYNKGSKELRPFIGVLFEINECYYFAPLSSPKPKHKTMKNQLDFMKIDDGLLGAINFNNMLPVNKNNCSLVDLSIKQDSISEIRYKKLLRKQLLWLNAHYIQVRNRSLHLYIMYTKNWLPENIRIRCCNFTLLEEKSKEYNKELQNV